MKAYDRERADPELVTASTYSITSKVNVLYALQALHCQDVLNDSGTTTFREYADDRIGPPDLNLLHNVAKKATKRHSIRSTSAEVSS